jgi:hypothetical protein
MHTYRFCLRYDNAFEYQWTPRNNCQLKVRIPWSSDARYAIIYWYVCLLQLGWHPVAVVQYTLTHKQYTEQHNETEYTEQNIHNNKNT